MYRFAAIRRERTAMAAVVLAAHVLLVWLLILMARGQLRLTDAASRAHPIYARIVEQPRPQPLGTPAPVKVTLIPVTRPKIPTPEMQLVEIETLDAPAPGPDPAPSSSQLVTRPGPANGGGQGYPASMGNQGLKLVHRVSPVYPLASKQRGEAGVVKFNVRVDPRGRVAEVRLLGSSGHALLDGAAARAVGKWRFEPLLLNGQPAGTWAQVNVEMSVYQHKYCRIRDVPADTAGDDVVDGAELFVPLGNEAGLRNLIERLGSGDDLPVQLRAMLDDWGPVLSIQDVTDAGYQGWVKREILPAFQDGRQDSTVQVRWDTYLVRHAQRAARWVVATDRNGEIWCVHAGPGPRNN